MRILDGPEYMCGRWYRIVSAAETLKRPRSATIEMVTIEIDAFASFVPCVKITSLTSTTPSVSSQPFK
jgi:hypothetical protein